MGVKKAGKLLRSSKKQIQLEDVEDSEEESENNKSSGTVGKSNSKCHFPRF